MVKTTGFIQGAGRNTDGLSVPCAWRKPTIIIRYHQQLKWRNDIARQREKINILEGVIHARESQK